MKHARREGLWLAIELSGGSLAVAIAAALNGWSLREQIVTATALLLCGASVAAPAGRRPLVALAWIPLLLLIIVGVGEVWAGIACGVIAAAVVAAALVARPPLHLPGAGILVCAFAISSGAIPFDALSIADAAIAAASLALLYAVGERGVVEPAAVAVVMLLAAVALPVPIEAAFFPAVLAAVIVAASSRSPVWLLLALAVAGFAGKWLLPPVLLTSTAILWRGRSMSADHDGAQPLLAFPAFTSRYLSGFFVLPLAGWPHWLNARAAGVACAAILVAAAAVIDRLWIALVWVLTSLLILLVTQRGSSSSASRTVLPCLAAVVAGGIGWSGALPAVFPLPVPWLWVAAIVVAISVVPFRAAVTAPVGALMLVALAAWVSNSSPVSGPAVVEKVLRAGESHVLDPAGSSNMEIVLRGGNVTRLAPEAPVAHIESVGSGTAYRRVVTAKQLGDWGALRPATFFSTQLSSNEAPGPLIGHGRDAFFRYSRSVVLADRGGVDFVRVVAHPELPPEVVVVVESVRTWIP